MIPFAAGILTFAAFNPPYFYSIGTFVFINRMDWIVSSTKFINMKRKDFLKGLGLTSASTIFFNTANSRVMVPPPPDCILIPSETEGPFPLDLTENTTFFRQDIRESEDGVQLNLKMKILGLENCGPMENVRVNIWHCTRDGVYSGYNTGNNPGDENATHLRGYQFTDANGEVEFTTIFPGWYNGRICHIHFQVYVSSSYSAISQLTFPIDTKNAIYAANPSLYPDGEDPLNFNTDMVFSDGVDEQLATLEENPDTGGYSSYLEVTVQGSGLTGVGHIERQTAQVFEMGQNFPNPYTDKTIVPINLKQTADIKLELWDLSGKKVATVLDERRSAEEFQVEVNPNKLGLPNGNYVYQLVADNGKGVFRAPKMMTYYK